METLQASLILRFPMGRSKYERLKFQKYSDPKKLKEKIIIDKVYYSTKADIFQHI